MSKMKLSDLVAKQLDEQEQAPAAPTPKSEVKIPAADAVEGVSTAIQRTLKFKEIDPTKCRPWRHHNRPEVWLTPENCAGLIESIQQEGQLELGLVRAVKDEPGIDYEIIFGVRRWYATGQIPGTKFKARVTQAPDAECALLMHVENEESEDISEFEKALSYDELVREKVFDSQKHLADSLRVSQAYISKLLRAAKVYQHSELRELLKPFSRELSVKHALDIVQLLDDKKTTEQVVDKALELGSEEGAGLGSLLTQLKGVSGAIAKPKNKEKCYFKNGTKKLLHAQVKSNGKFVLTVEPHFVATAGDQAEALLKQILKDAMHPPNKT